MTSYFHVLQLCFHLVTLTAGAVLRVATRGRHSAGNDPGAHVNAPVQMWTICRAFCGRRTDVWWAWPLRTQYYGLEIQII